LISRSCTSTLYLIHHHLTVVCTHYTLHSVWIEGVFYHETTLFSNTPSVSKEVCWNSFAHRQIFISCTSLYSKWLVPSWGFVSCFVSIAVHQPQSANSFSIVSAFDIVIKAQWGEWTAAHLGIAPLWHSLCTLLNVMLLLVV